jgi:alpha-glucosidase
LAPELIPSTTAYEEPWWKSAVLYQIYPRSFADSDGDGIGDIPGILDHLDHLEWLGVEGIWLSPVTVSPNADWGYDVADFCAVAPEFGSMDDVDRLIDQARRRGIRTLLDFVPNHTSDQHPWFLDSRSSRSAAKRDWYVWADPKPDGSPPNNWVSSFGGSAWTFDPVTSQSYVHNHLVEQPDLNWWNEEVRDTFDAIMRFWFDRGVAGLRIDVCNVIIKDAELRDNPPATEKDSFEEQMFGQRSVYNANRPEVHDVVRRWRVLADTYDEPRLLIGETPVPVDDLAKYYGSGRDELDLAFNFNFISAPLNAAAMRAVVEETEAALPVDAWPAWTGSNHDMFRFPSRWAAGDAAKSRLALLMLLGLRGTPILYQGDEIGMLDTKLDQADLKDPLGVLYWPHYEGRDAGRTPMQWSDVAGGGFTAAGARPWLPLGDTRTVNVADQRADQSSMLHLARDIIAFRRGHRDFCLAGYETVPTAEGAWAWRRGSGFVVVLNLSDETVTINGLRGSVAICTDRGREGEPLSGDFAVAPLEGHIVEIS